MDFSRGARSSASLLPFVLVQLVALFINDAVVSTLMNLWPAATLFVFASYVG